MNQQLILRTLPWLLVGVALLAAQSVGTAAEVDASLSAREAYVGAPVTLKLSISDAVSPQPPETPVIAGVDIESVGAPSRNSQTTIINGRRTDRTSVVYAWRLTPRREGTFTVPALHVQVDGQNHSTQPLRFAAMKSETGDLLFAEVSGQLEQIYVGQALPLTLHVWIKPYRDSEHQVTLSEGDMWQLLAKSTHWGAFADKVTELAQNNQRPAGQEELRPDTEGSEHAFYHFEIDALVYPQRPGQVDVGDVQIVLNYPTGLAKSRDPFAGMFGRDFPFGNSGLSRMTRNTLTIASARPVVADAQVEPIDVLPVPVANRPADYRGAVGRYKIATQATPTKVKAGDPITLHLGISGDGPMNLVQPPPLAKLPQLSADFQVPDEPLAGVVEGSAKLFTTTIRPRRAGVTSIPPIPLTFFDPETEQFETVHSQPIAIEVAAADRLALDAIVGGSNSRARNVSEAGDTTAKRAPDFTNDYSTQLIASDTPPRGWLLWVAFIFPPAIFAAWLLAKYARPVANKLGIAGSPSRARLKASVHKAGTPSELANVLRAILSQGSTSLHNAGEFETIIRECERAAYAGASVQSMSSLRSRALAIASRWKKIDALGVSLCRQSLLTFTTYLAIAGA